MYCFSDPEATIIDILYRWSKNLGQSGLCFYVFFCNIIIVKHFLYCFVILLYLISSFLRIISLFVPYAHVYIDYVFLSPLAPNKMFSTSSVNTLSFFLLNVWCDFNFNICFYECLDLWILRILKIFFMISTNTLSSLFFLSGFIPFSRLFTSRQIDLPPNKFQIYVFVSWQTFLWLLLFFYHDNLLNS